MILPTFVPDPPPLIDADFESVSIYPGDYPVVASPGWGSVRLTRPPSPFNVGTPIPNGVNVLVLQGTAVVSQLVHNWQRGWYRISLYASGRNIAPGYGGGPQRFRISIDDAEIFNVDTVSYQPWTLYTSPAFKVGDGSHRITFTGLQPFGGDVTSFIDQVRLESVDNAIAEPPEFLALGFANPFHHRQVGGAGRR